MSVRPLNSRRRKIGNIDYCVFINVLFDKHQFTYSNVTATSSHAFRKDCFNFFAVALSQCILSKFVRGQCYMLQYKLLGQNPTTINESKSAMTENINYAWHRCSGNKNEDMKIQREIRPSLIDKIPIIFL